MSKNKKQRDEIPESFAGIEEAAEFTGVHLTHECAKPNGN
jgi:hypothetical protein